MSNKVLKTGIGGTYQAIRKENGEIIIEKVKSGIADRKENVTGRYLKEMSQRHRDNYKKILKYFYSEE